MHTTCSRSGQRPLVAVTCFAAITLVGGGVAGSAGAQPLGPTVPPVATAAPVPAETWVAVSRGYPPTAASPADQIGGEGIGSTEHAAMIAALNSCVAHGGVNCGYLGATAGDCIALAVAGTKDWATAVGPVLYSAQRSALAQNPGGRILTSGCARSPILGNPGPVVAER